MYLVEKQPTLKLVVWGVGEKYAYAKAGGINFGEFCSKGLTGASLSLNCLRFSSGENQIKGKSAKNFNPERITCCTT